MTRFENTKVIIINPEDSKYSLTDGFINYLNAPYMHTDIMIEYGLHIYGEESIFGILSNDNYLPNVPAYFLSEEYGSIVLLNISDKKFGKQALLYLPSTVSFNQIDSLNSITKDMKGFSLEVNYDISLKDGLVESSTCIIKCDGKSDIIPNEQKKVKKKKA